jgi:hypothetical protein
MSVTGAVAGFLPSAHGLHFANRFPPSPLIQIGPLHTDLFGVADASNGLCGGMASYVRERFEAGQPIPADREPPPNGSPLFRALFTHQLQSLEWFRTPMRFWWIGAFGADRTASRSRDLEWPRIRDRIGGGHLAMVGLVRQHGVNPIDLQKSHQVLGYAFDATGDAVTLRVYDPNWPDRDDVTISIGPTTVRQSTGEVLFGVLSLG